ncbi:MAG TPA: hypothetical protein VN806_01970 [Caulobacteraceae bacterium]|nr:hypothetical protein [Caulobacteraceae bacterium]
MGSPLTMSSTVQCGHLGTVQVSSSTKLTIGGVAVLVQAGVAGKSVLLCTTLPTAAGNKPCQTVSSVLPISLSQKLTAGGNPVVLDSLKGLTDGVPPGTLLAVAGQAKLTTV